MYSDIVFHEEHRLADFPCYTASYLINVVRSKPKAGCHVILQVSKGVNFDGSPQGYLEMLGIFPDMADTVCPSPGYDYNINVICNYNFE